MQDFLDSITNPATEWLNKMNDAIYLWVVIGALIGAGIYLTVVTRGVQVRHFGAMFRHLVASRKGARSGISSFQAFTMGMATRIGIGNITGVALAMILGGPGALLWMWLVAALGMATAFAEATLAQVFKSAHPDGTFRGGPAAYIFHGIGSKPMAVTFAAAMAVCMAVVMPMVQSNTIAGTLDHSHGLPTWATALILITLTSLILLGGVRSVAKATEIITPIMAVAYLITAIAVIATNVDAVPSFFVDVVQSAFGLNEALSGIAGGVLAAILNGVRRGLFSNEAGMGTNPNAAATATVSHPVNQGLIQSLGVFFDTMVVCTATGFIISVSGILTAGPVTAEDADHLTTTAITASLGGWMAVPVSVMVFFFGFSSTLGAYTYANANVVFMKLGRSWELATRVSMVVFSGLGAVLALRFVWALMDTAMAVVTVINLIGVIALGSWVKAALADFEAATSRGEEPFFNPATAGLPGTLPTDGWDSVEYPQQERRQ